MEKLKQLLIVEDDKVDAITVERMLKDSKATFSVTHVTNGEEALKHLRSEVNELPSLILLDLNMPRMNGLEFLEEVKKDHRLCRIPVIVLTTSQEDRDIAKAFAHCIAGYMVKPILYEQFYSLIDIVNKYWSLNKLPN